MSEIASELFFTDSDSDTDSVTDSDSVSDSDTAFTASGFSQFTLSEWLIVRQSYIGS